MKTIRISYQTEVAGIKPLNSPTSLAFSVYYNTAA